MFCLRCGTKMTRGNLKGILVDYCPECKSFWLDKGELDDLRDGNKKDASEIKIEAKMESRYEPALSVKGACPKCFDKLKVYFEGSAKLDKCVRCEGMFFDRGELNVCLKEDRTSFLNKIMNLF